MILFGLQLLVLMFNLEVGTLPRDSFVMYAPIVYTGIKKADLYSVDFLMYTTMTADLKILEYGHIGGTWTMLYNLQGADNAALSSANFTFFTNIQYKNWELGWKHTCFHPITPYIMMTVNRPNIKWEGGYTQLYIKFSGECNIF